MKLETFILKGIRRVLCWCIEAAASMRLRISYRIVMLQLRGRKEKRFRVVFLVNELAKWKNQSLFELLATTSVYEPVIAVSVANFDTKLSREELNAKIDRTVDFFKARNMAVEVVFNSNAREPLRLDFLKPDIVFYQQPWGVPDAQCPQSIAHRALTCYVPYYVPNYGDRNSFYWLDLYKQVWCYFTLNEFWRKYLRVGASIFNHAGRIVSSGHPALDYFRSHQQREYKETVIYAPHWSFVHERHPNFENYGTFCQTGQFMLDYAQRHPEFMWVFKPHPTLRHELIISGIMTEADVSDYWNAWKECGAVYEGPEYQQLFVSSRAMVTDCGSFLVEYFATGHPLIHLISKEAKFEAPLPSRKIFDTFYKVHDAQNLQSVLDQVLVNGDDKLSDVRQDALMESGLLQSDSAENIKHYLDTVLLIK